MTNSSTRWARPLSFGLLGLLSLLLASFAIGSEITHPSGPGAFIENVGQWDAHARFKMTGQGVNLWLNESGARYQFMGGKPVAGKGLRTFTLQVNFLGGRSLRLNPVSRLDGIHHFITGRKALVTRSAHQYAGVEARNVYPGIDVRFSSTKGLPRYDLIVKPGADPDKIRVQFDGINKMRSRPDGVVEMQTPLGILTHKDLNAYQGEGTSRRQVFCSVTCEGNVLRFHPDVYDHSKPLVIDPVIAGTYFGTGSETMTSFSGSEGKVMMSGTTPSNGYPVSLGLEDNGSLRGGTVGYVTVLTADMKSLVYSTWIGEGLVDGSVTEGESIADAVMDSKGRVELASVNHFDDFGTVTVLVRMIQLDVNGDISFNRVVLSDLNPQFAPKIKIAVSPSANVIALAGQAPIDGSWFVLTQSGAGLNNQQTGFLFTNENALDQGGVLGVCVTDQGEVAVAGETFDLNYPTTAGVFSTTGNTNGVSSGFVTTLNPSLTVKASTFVAVPDGVRTGMAGIAPDGQGGFAITGYTDAQTWPVTSGAFQVNSAAGLDAVMVRLTGDLKSIVASTFVGGNGNDFGQFLRMDADGSVWIAGISGSSDYPAAFSPEAIPSGQGFVSHLSADCKQLMYGTTWRELSGFFIAPDTNLYMGGVTGGIIPTTAGALKPSPSGLSSLYASGITTVASVSSISVAPATLFGGQSSTGTVFLTKPAPAGGASVALKSSHATTTVPASVVVPAGQTRANFTVTTLPTSIRRVNAITATSGTSSANTLITMISGNTMSPTITVDKLTLPGGTALKITVGINAPAKVPLTAKLSSNNAVIKVPSTLPIPVGASSVSTTVITKGVDANVVVRVAANVYSTADFKDVTVTPAPFSAFTITPASVVSGKSAVGRITLNGVAGSEAQTFNLSSTAAFLVVPASIKIQPGQNTATFTISTLGVAADSVGPVKAVRNAVTSTASLTVTPAALNTFTLSATTVKGGNNVAGTVKLTGFAPPAGFVVTTTSSGTATVPASVKVLANTSALSFTISTVKVTSNKTVTLTAKAGAKTIAVTLTVTP